MTTMHRALAFAAVSLTACGQTPSISDAGEDEVDAHVAEGDAGPAMITTQGGTELTFADGTVVGGLPLMSSSSQPLFLWAHFEPNAGVCLRLQDGGLFHRSEGVLTVVVRGAFDQDTHFAPVDGDYPIFPGQPDFESPPAQAMIAVTTWTDGVVGPERRDGASGVVRVRNLGAETADVEVDATLADGTVVSGAMRISGCPDVPTTGDH